ncbi:MAG TPA: histidine--tRNA ligase [Hyphomicrobiaceae bacterium]|nr:histidine--tRNA ligase [Hyphomicrobiaceae bacterium]
MMTKHNQPKARLPKGFQDTFAEDLRTTARLVETIREVYELYGFEPLDTSIVEYTDALGKFLPDQDRPNAGVFSFQDEDEQWMSLRYDLTAPLARHVAENFDKLPKPFRRYAVGPVFRNEKPGPGRFRQFMQFDADTVGSESIAADAEICMLAADAMERVGVPRGKYRIKVSNRKVLNGLMEAAGLAGEAMAGQRLTVLRAIDKLDKFGPDGVRLLLGPGRRDESGDFTKGAGLEASAIDTILAFTAAGSGATSSNEAVLDGFRRAVGSTDVGAEGVAELAAIAAITKAAGYDETRVVIDSSIVRGLEYYTGPVFEAELTFEVKNEDGQTVRFGSVGGGGRYDDLVARFTGQRVPATGFSIGVSRIEAAFRAISKSDSKAGSGPVVVLVMDKGELPRFQRHVQALRGAGIRAELYLGASGMKAQMKYADRRNAPCVVIQGGDEIARGEVQVKDLVEGARAAASIKDSKAWREGRPAQMSVPEARLVEAVREILARHAG